VYFVSIEGTLLTAGGALEGGALEGGALEGGALEGGALEGGALEGGALEAGVLAAGAGVPQATSANKSTRANATARAGLRVLLFFIQYLSFYLFLFASELTDYISSRHGGEPCSRGFNPCNRSPVYPLLPMIVVRLIFFGMSLHLF